MDRITVLKWLVTFLVLNTFGFFLQLLETFQDMKRIHLMIPRFKSCGFTR